MRANIFLKTVFVISLTLVGFVQSTAAQSLTPGDDFSDGGNGSLTSVLPSRALGVASPSTACVERPPVYCAPLTLPDDGVWFAYTHVIPAPPPPHKSLWRRLIQRLSRHAHT